jgi:cystathionine beta-lyase
VDGNYEINMAHFERAITDRTRVFLMCNPHNPVGRAFDKHELETMASVCLKHKLVICSDEIHCDIVFNGKRHIPIASLDPEISNQTITLMAASKSFNIAGLNCAFAVIQNPELHQKFCAARKGLVGGVNVLGLVAALSAYKEGQSWLNHLLMYLESNRDFLYNYVNQEMPGVSMGLPEATYLAWLDCRKSAIPGNPYQFFLENARVACNDGDHFGSGGKGFVRLNFGCPRSMLQEALERMKNALLKIN